MQKNAAYERMSYMKKLLLATLCLLLTGTFINSSSPRIHAAETTAESNADVQATFTPDDEEAFRSLPDDTIIGAVDDYVIKKSNLNSDYTVNWSSVNQSQFLKPAVQTRSITESTKSLPKGYYSAETHHTLSNIYVNQKTTTTYLTANLANLYVAKQQSSGAQNALTWLFGAAFSKISKIGLALATAISIKDILDQDFLYQITKLSTKGKKVKIAYIKSNYGKIKTVSQWKDNKIKLRNGSTKQGGYLTTEKTTYGFSKKS